MVTVSKKKLQAIERYSVMKLNDCVVEDRRIDPRIRPAFALSPNLGTNQRVQSIESSWNSKLE